MRSKFGEREEEFRRAAWVGADVVTAAGSVGVIEERWADDDGKRAVVRFQDGTSAPVDYADLRAAPVACAYDVGKGRAELARRKTSASATCGAVYSPDLPTEKDRARCASCGKIATALDERQVPPRVERPKCRECGRIK